MDKNSYIGLGLIALILILFGIFSQPSQQEIDAMKRKQDSLATIERERIEKQKIEQLKKDSIEKVSKTVSDSLKNDSVVIAEKKKNFGVFSNASKGINKDYILQNEYLKLTIASKGGRIKTVELLNHKTFDGKPLLVFEGDSSQFGLNFQLADENDKLHYSLVNTENLFFQSKTEGDSLSTTNADSVVLVMRVLADSGKTEKYIDFVYTLRKSSYMVGFEIKLQGFGDQIMTREYIDFIWKHTVLSKEKSISNERTNTTVYFKFFKDDEVDYLSETSDDSKKLDTKVNWIGFKEQFFTSVIISQTGFVNAEISALNHNESFTKLRTLTAGIGIPYNPAKPEAHKMDFYFGPNKYQILSDYNLDLERQIPIGWGFFIMAWVNRFLVIPIFNLLESTGMNYGIIILILTLIIKLLLFPIAYKTYISSAKMKLLKPDIDELKEKYPKKEDALKKQQATMALYKKAGVNPLSGCIPMLLQFPILIALFRFFPSAIELRQQGFLWADDLSSYDSILDLGFNIPMYGDHISLFTLLMTISTIVYTKMNSSMMSDSQMPMMKWMMYLMPIMFLGIFNNFSSGLSYYYFLTNIITIGQQFLIKKFIVNEDKLRKQIQENKAKNVTVKKSKWQQRLEEMAKQRGYKPKK